MNDLEKYRAFRLTALCALVAVCFAGCGGSRPQAREGDIDELLASQQEPTAELRAQSLMVEKVQTDIGAQEDSYTIGPNDVLHIIVLGHDELSSPRDPQSKVIGTVVKKDGRIYMPIVGPIQAAGHTLEEFHEVFATEVAKYIADPQFTIDIISYESKKFYVLGEVKNPGAFPVDGDTTLLEGIGMAHGVTEQGNLELAYVVRDNALLPINLGDLIARGDTSRNVYMRDGDLVYIPSAFDQKVFVLGEVSKPGGILMPRGRISLAGAIAEAGGLLPIESDKSSIKLIRGGWQEPTVYTLSYETVLNEGDRILLQPGDRVVVQPTMLTTASRYMQQILPFLVGADAGTRVYDRMSTR